MLIIGYFMSGRADIAPRLMATLSIVEGFDGKENVRAHLLRVIGDHKIEPLLGARLGSVRG